MEGSEGNIYSSLCGVLCKEGENSLVPWSVTDPDAKINCFTWYKDNNDWIVPEDQYDEVFKNWRGPIHNCQFCSQTLKDKRKTEDVCSKYAGSANFNGIPREGNPVIPIKSYKYQCRDHMIGNRMWDIFSLLDPHNKEKRWNLLLHQYIFPLEYLKHHVQSLLKGSEADQYVV